MLDATITLSPMPAARVQRENDDVGIRGERFVHQLLP